MIKAEEWGMFPHSRSGRYHLLNQVDNVPACRCKYIPPEGLCYRYEITDPEMLCKHCVKISSAAFANRTKPPYELTSCGGSCPVQAEGTCNGADFYLRLRSTATLELKRGDEEWFMDVEYFCLYMYPEESFYGYYSEKDATLILEQALVAWLANPDKYRV